VRILSVVGARPNFVKMAPVVAELRRRFPGGRHVLVHTGQHYDRLMSEVFLAELDVPQPDHLLGVGSGSHAVQTARVSGAAAQFVGNTMIDSLRVVEPRLRAAGAAHRLGLPERGYLLVTLHRPALVDDRLLDTVMQRLSDIARELPLLFPVHSRTCRWLEALDVAGGIHVVDPLCYLDFLSLQADAAAILTDSGGVQDESTCLGVPCFTLRADTERPVTVRARTNTLLGIEPERIGEILPALAASPGGDATSPALWDGRAAGRVADVLERSLESGSVSLA
jgi:UDP-N-acetylglucosamine 2-epimerase (non-hydrolysing)